MLVHHQDILTVGVIPLVPIAISMVTPLALPRRTLIVGVTRLPLIATSMARLLVHLRLTLIAGVTRSPHIAINMDKQSVLPPVILIAGVIPRQDTPIHTAGVQSRLVHTLTVGEIPQQTTGIALVRTLVLRRAILIRLETQLPNRAVATRILQFGRGEQGCFIELNCQENLGSSIFIVVAGSLA